MKVVVENEKYGKIEYSESFWSGSKQISINDTKLEKKTRGISHIRQWTGCLM